MTNGTTAGNGVGLFANQGAAGEAYVNTCRSLRLAMAVSP